MKYWRDSFGNIDPTELWAYEGVVLPGGQIIIGRWWYPSPDPDPLSGPFILWNIDTPALLAAENAKMSDEKMSPEL